MRLLKLAGSGRFNLVNVTRNNIPPYAILSHTWEDGKEVSFQDFMKGTGKEKTGFGKIQFCGEQAAKDNIQYFWVDTCCIDKSNNTELTKAINSMFRWYQNAAKCYVYLSDVSTADSDANVQKYRRAWEAELRKSRWFTRGWTLQELIAPTSVEFFSRQQQRLGDKKSLEKEIHEITGIPSQALHGNIFSDFSIPERIAWAAKRETTEEEDAAYSLLGICEVFMPLIYGEGKLNAMNRLKREVDRNSEITDETELRKVDNAIFLVPFERNSRFTGQESKLAQLEQKLFVGEQTTKIAITGLGGIGKTQLALELAYRTAERYKNCSVFWILANDKESIYEAYLKIARQLSIPIQDWDTENVMRLVQHHLSQETTGRWLLIFDNADDINVWISSPKSERRARNLIEYLPRSKLGCIVFTTRDRKTAIKLATQNLVEIMEMDEHEATQLLKNCLIDRELANNQDTKILLEQLAYLPLAIIQAAAYINENRIGLSEYVSLLKNQEEEVVDLLSEEFEDEWRYDIVKNPVATTWLISFEQIKQNCPLAAEYLSFMACIDRSDIPQFLLPAGLSRKKEIDAIGTLDAYSFIIRNTDLSLDLHRLVHLATRNWLRREGLLASWTRKSIERLYEAFPDTIDAKDRNKWRVLLPHARYTLKSDLVQEVDENRAGLTWKCALGLREEGWYDEAETYLQRVMETFRKGLGEDNPDTLDTMDNLVVTYMYQGRWEEAEKLGVRVMESRKNLLGDEHPSTLTSMHRLVWAYRNQGKWKTAEELGAQVVEIRKRVLGEEHLDTLKSKAELVVIYSFQGFWERAEELAVEVMEMMKKMLGLEHPETLTSMANVAEMYWSQGRKKEAEELETQVLETRKRVLGEDHPITLTSMRNLAVIWNSCRRNTEALQLLTDALRLARKRLGDSHSTTLEISAQLHEWTGA